MTKLFNLEKFIEQTAGDRHVATQVYYLYRDSFEKDLKDITLAAATGEYEVLRRLAHKSKSSFIIMGSEALFSMALIIEDLSKENNPEVIRKVEEYSSLSRNLMEQLNEEFG